MRYVLTFLLTLLALAACTHDGTSAWTPAPQHWQEMTVRVESRPETPRVGMNEFLVMVDRPHHGFSTDLIVQVRTESSGGWKQAMPDGALGVYRRALRVGDLAHEHLFVRILRSDGARGELRFALRQPLPSSKP